MYSAELNGCKSPMASPVPMNLIGNPLSRSIASATPPFALPSNLVITNPVIGAKAMKLFA
jgi:hypothetical protein